MWIRIRGVTSPCALAPDSLLPLASVRRFSCPAGAVVGSVVGFGLILAALLYCCCCCSQQSGVKDDGELLRRTAAFDSAVIALPVFELTRLRLCCSDVDDIGDVDLGPGAARAREAAGDGFWAAADVPSRRRGLLPEGQELHLRASAEVGARSASCLTLASRSAGSCGYKKSRLYYCGCTASL